MKRKRLVLAILVVAFTATGLFTRMRAAGFLPGFMQEYGGDFMWAAALYFLLGLIRPNAFARELLIVTLILAYLVETSQIIQGEWINTIRNTSPFGYFLGYTFLWSDIFCYSAGAVCSYFIDRLALKGRIFSMVFLLPIASMLPEAESSAEPVVIGETHQLHSEILQAERTVSVSLPVGYEESDRDFPVLILLDCGGAVSLAHAYSTMELLDSKGLAPQMIIVGVDPGVGVRDYFPLPLQGRSGSGKADEFLSFIIDELIPFLENNYRTAPYRVLYGGSNAGMFTIHSMLELHGEISGFVAASPSLSWFPDHFQERIAEWAPSNDTRLYLNMGSDDIQRIVSSHLPSLMEGLQEKFGDAEGFKAEIIQEGGHVPYISLYNGLCTVFNGWKYPDSLIMSDGLAPMVDHYETLSGDFGFTVVPPGASFMALGQHQLRSGNLSDAMAAFSSYAECYPNSARAVFFLGETHRALSDTASAEQCYRRTIELNPNFTLASERLESILEGEEQ